MIKWKTLGIHILLSIAIFIIGGFLITILSYLDVLKGTSLTISKFFISFLSMIVGSYLQGKSCHQKGFLAGLELGGILVFLLFLFNYAFYQMFAIKNLGYYGILLVLSMVGGMIGISRKKEKK